MLTDDIRKELFRLQDTQYRDFPFLPSLAALPVLA